MTENYMCVSIPRELQSFAKCKDKLLKTNIQGPKLLNFGVKFIKKIDGKLDYAAHYSDTGELVKKVYYEGSRIKKIQHFSNNILYMDEEYSDDLIVRKIKYSKDKTILSKTGYTYNRNNKITSIRKTKSGNTFSVEYGYDELERVNRRIVSYNHEIVKEQKYRFDILDRIVEYSDNNQTIRVQKISPDNKLIYYSITDKIGNEITIINNFFCSEYQKTEVTLNGHKIELVDKNYVDNIMLKKPYATEDDLDLIISNLFNEKTEYTTKRTSLSDTADSIIDNTITARALPISLRKRVLYNMSLNLL